MKTMSSENKTVIGYIIIGICVIILGSTVISALVLKGEKCDPETFCRDDVSAHTIVVLDKTDKLNSNQQRAILNYINREKSRLDTFEKFSIFTLTDSSYANPDPIFSKCCPGTGKEANQLYQNPRKIQLRFDQLFSKPLKENMSDIFSNDIGSKSPIMEMIRDLSFRDDFGEAVQKRTLIIISDMMQNTLNYSQYSDSLDYTDFSQQPYADELTTNLGSVDVIILYLHRDHLRKIQGKRHLSFWKRYLEETGAGNIEVRHVG